MCSTIIIPPFIFQICLLTFETYFIGTGDIVKHLLGLTSNGLIMIQSCGKTNTARLWNMRARGFVFCHIRSVVTMSSTEAIFVWRGFCLTMTIFEFFLRPTTSKSAWSLWLFYFLDPLIIRKGFILNGLLQVILHHCVLSLVGLVDLEAFIWRKLVSWDFMVLGIRESKKYTSIKTELNNYIKFYPQNRTKIINLQGYIKTVNNAGVPYFNQMNKIQMDIYTMVQIKIITYRKNHMQFLGQALKPDLI